MKYANTTSGAALIKIESEYVLSSVVRLHHRLQFPEATRPEACKEGLEIREPPRVDFVQPSPSLASYLCETRTGQHLEMLRHRLLADVEMFGYLVD